MHIPKHYFHDRSILVLSGINSLLVLIAVLFILLRVDPAKGGTHIVQYRSNLGIGAFKSGSISEFRVIAAFAITQYVFGWLLSMRLYVHRRHMSLVILALTMLLLILTVVVSNALLLVN